jgi:hypothetical protein
MTGAISTAAIRSMGSSAEEIEYNIINGLANTTGMIAQNTTGNIYGCNNVAGTAEGLGIYYNAELHDIRAGTFDEAYFDLYDDCLGGGQELRGTGGTLPASGIRLYPNPSQGVVNVRLPMGYNGQLVVYGPDGRALQQQRIVDGNLHTLQLGGQSGLYLARFLSDSGESSTHKLIVMD